MTAEETIASLEGQLKDALERLREGSERLRETEEHLQQGQARIAELEKQKTPPPSFVKANKKQPPAQEKQPRKKRAAQYHRARQRSVPPQVVEHRIVACPACHLRLGGISLARCHAVIDVPPPPRVEVSEQRISKGWGTGWKIGHEARVEFCEQGLGQGRIGVRLASIMAYLRSVMRLPLRQRRAVLRDLHGFEVRLGELVERLHRMRAYAQPTLSRLKAESRPSPAVQAAESGWREDGKNGYIWSVSTPRIRYYEYQQSRRGQVVKQLIGEDWKARAGQ